MGLEEGKVFLCKVGAERTLDWDVIYCRCWNGEPAQWKHCGQASHRQGFVCLAVGTARRLSVRPAALFLQSSAISQASAISTGKGTELFSLSHQQLGLSTIRPIGPKPLCYRQLTEANTGNPGAHVACFMWLPQRQTYTVGLLALPAWTFGVKIFTSSVIPHLQGSSRLLFLLNGFTQSELYWWTHKQRAAVEVFSLEAR